MRKYLLASAWVTVTGRRAEFADERAGQRSQGPRTLPRRTAFILVAGKADVGIAQVQQRQFGDRLEAPIMLRGFTALSVEIMSRRSAPKRAAVLANSPGAEGIVRTTAKGFDSISGTCLKAAA